MWQQILIALVVAAASTYVTWSVIGSRLRLRVLDVMTRCHVARRWVAQQREKLATGGCGNCSVPKRKVVHR
jgi:hypothetical protein